MERIVSIRSTVSWSRRIRLTMRFVDDNDLVGQVDIECLAGVLLQKQVVWQCDELL